MQPFTFYTPTKINFGEDTARGIGDALFETGVRKPLIVTDSNLRAAGLLNLILKSMEESGLEDMVIFDEVPPDSDLMCVRKATELGKKAACDSVIAVGGGSVLDTAKVANIGLTASGDILDYEGLHTLSSRLMPMIAVPTTAGTGSEVSCVAMIKDHGEHKKLLFGSRFLFPDVAILDPKLLLSLPSRLTAATGVDALTHAIESYTATTKNSPTDAFCLESMRLIFANLPKATKHGSDIEARSATLVGSMMAGISFTNAGVGIVHALAHSFGARYGTHHGMTNAVFLPFGMEYNLDQVKDKFARAFTFCSTSGSITDSAPASQWFEQPQSSQDSDCSIKALQFIQAVKELNTCCQLPTRLKDLGIAELSDQDLEQLAETAMTDPAMMFNPKQPDFKDIIDIIKRAY